MLYWVNGFNQYASALSQVCSIYTVEMAASNMANTITICCVNTYKLHMHLERNYFIYIYMYTPFLLYSAYSYGMGGI